VAFFSCLFCYARCVHWPLPGLDEREVFSTILFSSFQMNKTTASGLICPHQFFTCSPTLHLVLFYLVPPLTVVPQQEHLHGQWLGKRYHGCPPIWWLFVYMLHWISVISLCISMNISGLKNISNISHGELSWVIWKFVFIPGTLEKAGFWTILSFFFPF